MTTLYLDMDGVLADFNAQARITLGATAQDERDAAARGRWPAAEWAKLRDIPNFYLILPKTSFADELVTLARRFRDELGWQLRVLTAIPKGNDMPEAFQDKMDWMRERYPDIRVHFGPYSHDKQHHAEPGDVLVDDRASNCSEWISKGGIAIRVHDSDPRAALGELSGLLERKLALKRLAGLDKP